MEYLAKITGVVALYALAMLSPGPNFIVITRTSLSESRKRGLFTGLGVATGSALWAAIGAFGLGFLLVQMTWLAGALKVAGGLYLLYLAYKFLRGARQPMATSDGSSTAIATRGRWSAYRMGLFTNLTNPKSAAFFASLFASAVSPTTPLWVYLVLIASIGTLSAIWHALLALVFSTPAFQNLYRRVKTGIDVVCGVLLMLVGLHLITAL